MTKDYNNADVVQKLENLKQEDYVTERNAELMEKFRKNLVGRQNCGCSRQVWYISRFSTIFRKFLDPQRYEKDPLLEGCNLEHENLDELTRSDMIAIRQAIERLPKDDTFYDDDIDETAEERKQKEGYAERTFNDFRTALKVFYKERHPVTIDRPKRVHRILESGVLQRMQDPERKRDPIILTPDHVRKLSDAAMNPRDRLIPILLLDCGARPSEVLSVTRSDILEKNSQHWTVRFQDHKNGKDDRELPLTHCLPQLQEWMESHPRKDDPDANILVNLKDKNGGETGEVMTQDNLNATLRRLADRTDLDFNGKKLQTYDFRHSSATMRGTEKDWKPQRMKWWYAWKKTSRADTYCHDDNDRMKKAILREKGMDKEDEDEVEPMAEKYCSRCDEPRSSEYDYCPECSLPLDTENALKMASVEKTVKEIMSMKLDDDEINDEELQEVVAEVQKR